MSWKTGGNLFHRTDFRLTLLYSATFFFSALLICGFLYLRVKSQLVRELDRFLLDECIELSEGLSKPLDDKVTFRDFENQFGSRTHYPLFLRVLSREGSPVFVSERFGQITHVTDRNVLRRALNGQETRQNIHPPEMKRPLRLVSFPFYRGGVPAYILQVGTHLKYFRKNLFQFRRSIYVALPIVLLLSSLGGWFLARKSLSPIGYISAKTRQITSEKLNERLLSRGTGDELDDLIQTINGMIGRLETSFKRMAEFTADASHELKTPLCALRGEAEVLLTKERGREEYKETLGRFIEQFDQMTQMLNDLILLSKSDSAQVELRISPVRIDLLISDLLSLFQAFAEQKRIVLTVDPLPEVVVLGDKIRLQQLFTNLIQNAIKYTSEGSVQVSLAKDDRSAVVRITDTGIGIPKEEQERIFKRFYRVDKSRSKETGGVGLGLSIAEWIAHVHRGTIEVDSELKKGATFTVRLPLKTSS